MAVPAEKQERHEFLTEFDSAKDFKFNYKVDSKSVLLDLKALMSEYYVATFEVAEDALKLQFTNGQAFLICAKEVL